MKHLINGILFLAIVGTAFFTSCSKSEVYDPNVAETSVELRQEIVTNKPKFVDNGGDDYGCFEENGCCIPEVYIDENKEPIHQVFTIIDNGNDTEISNSFQTNMHLLVKFLDFKTVNDVINNNLEVKHRYNKTQDRHYLLFNKGDELHSVYPVTLR